MEGQVSLVRRRISHIVVEQTFLWESHVLQTVQIQDDQYRQLNVCWTHKWSNHKNDMSTILDVGKGFLVSDCKMNKALQFPF